MAISDEELGKLVRDYCGNESRTAGLEASLAQASEHLALLATRLKDRPESITVGQAKIVFRDEGHNDRTVPLAALDTGHICKELGELQQAAALKKRIKAELTEAGLERLARTLEAQGPPITGA